jgi:Response regulator containing a CheY-like receiver domain and an HTH DNA-binding domain
MASYHHFASVSAFDFKNCSQYFAFNMPPAVTDYFDTHHPHKTYPGIISVFSNGAPIWLSDMLQDPDFIKTGHDAVVREGIKIAGEGLCIPLYGPNNRHGYLFIAFGKEKTAFATVLPFQVQALAQMLHVRYCLMIKTLHKQVQLTSREAEVLELISFGKTNKDIGEILNISSNTVAGYVKKIFLKLDVSDRVSAAMRAQTIKIII